MSEKKTTKYHIYGRIAYPQPLEFIKVVNKEALALPEGEDWVEVIAFPETAVIQVIPRQKEEQVLEKQT